MKKILTIMFLVGALVGCGDLVSNSKPTQQASTCPLSSPDVL